MRPRFTCMTLECTNDTGSADKLFCRICAQPKRRLTKAEEQYAADQEYRRQQEEEARLEAEDRPPDFWREDAAG